MRKILFFALLLFVPHSTRAQVAVVGASCSAAGQNAISNTGTPVVCTQPPGGGALVWTAVSGPSGGSSSPSPSTIYAWSSKYNLPAIPAVYVCDATYNATTTVTTPTTDPAFVVGTVYPVAWGYTQMQCGGNPDGGGHVQLIPNGATATATAAHSLTLSSAALAGCTPGNQGLCSLVVGFSAAAGITSAYNDMIAAGPGSTLVFPAGGLILDSVPTGGTMPCSNTGGGNDTPCAYTIYGQGPFSTTLLMAPGLTFPSGLFIPANYLTNGVMFANFHDFGLMSMSPETAGQNGQFIFSLHFGAQMHDVNMMNLYPQVGTNFTCAQIVGVQNSITSFHNNQLLNACGVGVNVSGSDVNVSDNWIQGSNQCLTISGNRIKTWGNRISLCGTNSAVNISGSAVDWESLDTVLEEQGTSLPVLNVGGTSGQVRLHNFNIICSNTTGSGLLVGASGPTVYIGGLQGAITCTTGSSIALINQGTLFIDHTNLTQGGSSGISFNNSGTVTIGAGVNFSSGLTNTGTINVVEGEGGHNGGCTGTVVTGNNGLNLNSIACAATTGGVIMGKAGTVYGVFCNASAAGSTASDTCTLFKNGASTALTCSMNGVTTCTDGTAAHQVAYVASDRLQVVAVAGAGSTMANPQGAFIAP